MPDRNIGDRVGLGLLATGRAVLGDVPVVKTLMNAIERSDRLFAQRRHDEWLRWLLSNEDNEAFAEHIAKELEGAESSRCRATVVESARSARDAVADGAIPVIALLTRMHLKEQRPEARTFRELLALFRTMDGEEIEGLRVALPVLRRFELDNAEDGERKGWSLDVAVGTMCSPSSEGWVWQATHVLQQRTGPHTAGITVNVRPVELLRGDVAFRIASAILGKPLGAFGEPTMTTGPAFPHGMIELLAELLTSRAG